MSELAPKNLHLSEAKTVRRGKPEDVNPTGKAEGQKPGTLHRKTKTPTRRRSEPNRKKRRSELCPTPCIRSRPADPHPANENPRSERAQQGVNPTGKQKNAGARDARGTSEGFRGTSEAHTRDTSGMCLWTGAAAAASFKARVTSLFDAVPPAQPACFVADQSP